MPSLTDSLDSGLDPNFLKVGSKLRNDDALPRSNSTVNFSPSSSPIIAGKMLEKSNEQFRTIGTKVCVPSTASSTLSFSFETSWLSNFGGRLFGYLEMSKIGTMASSITRSTVHYLIALPFSNTA